MEQAHKKSLTIKLTLTISILSLLVPQFSYGRSIFEAASKGGTSSTSSSNTSGKTKQPYGTETSSISPPIPVTVENLEDIGNSATAAILNGYTWTSDALTAQLYPVLSNSLSQGIAYLGAEVADTSLNTASATAIQTGTPTSGPYSSNAAIQYDLTTATDYVFNSIINPIDTNFATTLSGNTTTSSIFVNANNYSTNTIASKNLQNVRNADNSSTTTTSGTTIPAAKININDILSTQNGNDLTATDSLSNTLILLKILLLQNQSCSSSLSIQNSGSSSSSSSSSSSTNNNASTYGNVAGTTNLLCTPAQAACMITYAVNSVIPDLTTRLTKTNSKTGKSLKDTDPIQYNYLYNLLTSDAIKNLTSTYNMNINNTECIGASSSSYPSISFSQGAQDFKVLNTVMAQVANGLKTLIQQDIAVSIIEALAKNPPNKSSSSDELAQIYTLTKSSDINTLLGPNSLIGIPSNQTICTLKVDQDSQTLEEKINAVAASTLIDSLSDAGSTTAILGDIPLTADTAAIGGGFGLVDNTGNFASSDASTIDSARTAAQSQYDSLVTQYNNQFSGYNSNKSIPLGILNNFKGERTNIITIPEYYDSTGIILNPATSDARSLGYIPAGETCTSKEIEHYAATYRLNPDPSTGKIETSAWQKSISSNPNQGILAKEEVQLLAEIRAQLYEENLQLEKELAMASINVLNTLSKNVGVLSKMNNDIDTAIKSFIQGSEPTKSTSSGSS